MEEQNIQIEIAKVTALVVSLSREVAQMESLVRQLREELTAFRISASNDEKNYAVGQERSIGKIKQELIAEIHANKMEISRLKIQAGLLGTMAGTIPIIVLEMIQRFFP